MIQNFKVRWATVIVAVLIGVIWTLPNMVTLPEGWLLSTKKLSLGLDIQGGLHLVLGVDAEAVVKEKTTRLVKNLEGEFKNEEIPYSSVVLADEKTHTIAVGYATPQDRDKIRGYIERMYNTVLQIVDDADQKLSLRYFDAYMIETRKNIVNQAIEVIRNRVDEFGVAEPSISAQGADRILVQLPGVKDAARAKDLINKTARLDFRVVSNEVPVEKLDQMIREAEGAGKYSLGGDETKAEGALAYSGYIKKLNDDLKDKLPGQTRVVFEKMDNAVTLEAGRRPYLVKTDTNLSGDQLEDAFVGYNEYGRPQVNFRLNVEGSKLFADMSGENVGGTIAIILDEVVKSAPRVEAKITGGSAQITLGSGDPQTMLQEAQFIATTLRAGALPAALEQLEERTVGPTLGAESIAKGQKGALYGTILVVVFMVVMYGILGVVASLAVGLNLLFVFGALSTLGATLTLPGVAGFALTVGMAVDANIIIYERIKEELARGANAVSAIRDGFENAFSAIADSNITTILTCVILMYFGTGPVRGFAVSLAIGIIASMFTAIFFARLLIETLAVKFNMPLVKTKKAAV